MQIGNPTTPLVSIIVPFHNRNEELNALIDTMPDRPDLEVILVNDQSTEKVSIMRNFERTILRHLATSEGARFAGSARNIGLDAALGEFLYFCDSDDLLVTEAFDRAMARLGSFDGDVLHTLTTSFFDDGREGTRTAGYNHMVHLLAEQGDNGALVRFHPPWAKFLRRSFVVSSGARFDQTRVSNDVMFNAHLSVARPVREAFLEVTYRVRQGNVSLTSDGRVENIVQRLEVLRRYNDLLRSHGLNAYQGVAFTHIKRILVSSPGRAMREAIRTLLLGHPLFATRHSLSMKIGMRRRRIKKAV